MRTSNYHQMTRSVKETELKMLDLMTSRCRYLARCPPSEMQLDHKHEVLLPIGRRFRKIRPEMCASTLFTGYCSLRHQSA